MELYRNNLGNSIQHLFEHMAQKGSCCSSLVVVVDIVAVVGLADCMPEVVVEVPIVALLVAVVRIRRTVDRIRLAADHSLRAADHTALAELDSQLELGLVDRNYIH